MASRSHPKPSQPCPCGSGKKYKHCCAVKHETRRRTMRRFKKMAAWIGAAAVAVAIVYGLTQTASVPYTDADLAMVDFGHLSASDKQDTLQEVNSVRCTCGCGMTLAQCVVTDSTCPLRSNNIERIRTMVDERRDAESL